MARKLSIRKRDGSYQIGPAGHKAPTASVSAPGKREALRRAKAELRERGEFAAAARGSCRSYARVGMRDGRKPGQGKVAVPVTMDTTPA